MSASVKFIPPNGLSELFTSGFLLVTVCTGGRETLGERVIREGGRRRCTCDMNRIERHG